MRLGKTKGRRISLPATVIPPYVLSKKKNQNKKLYRRSTAWPHPAWARASDLNPVQHWTTYDAAKGYMSTNNIH
jgi:hypothetical protein